MVTSSDFFTRIGGFMASLEGLNRFLTEHVEGPLLFSFGFKVSFAAILSCLIRGVERGHRHWLE